MTALYIPIFRGARRRDSAVKAELIRRAGLASPFLLSLIVAHETHRHCTIISRPRHRPEIEKWLPHTTVAWRDKDGFHYHEFDDFGRKFDSEKAALAFGFAIARAWIDDAL